MLAFVKCTTFYLYNIPIITNILESALTDSNYSVKVDSTQPVTLTTRLNLRQGPTQFDIWPWMTWHNRWLDSTFVPGWLDSTFVSGWLDSTFGLSWLSSTFGSTRLGLTALPDYWPLVQADWTQPSAWTGYARPPVQADLAWRSVWAAFARLPTQTGSARPSS